MKKVIVKGMSCQHCVSSVKKALADIEDINKVDVDLATNSVYIYSDNIENLDENLIKETIEDIGYDVISFEK